MSAPTDAGSTIVDVVIVGGGLAGLRAADELSRRGRKVVLLEARDRVGGRTETKEVDGYSFDLGGQWLGAHQPKLEALVRDLGVRTFAQFHEGTKILEQSGKISTYKGNIPKLPVTALVELQLALYRLERAMVKVPLDAPLLAPNALALDSESVASYADKMVRSERVKSALTTACRVVFGAELRELSMLYFLFYLRSGGGLLKLCEIEGAAQETRFVEGAMSVSTRLLERVKRQGVEVHLNCPVRRIEQPSQARSANSNVRLSSDKGSFEARFAIVAIPPAMAGRIEIIGLSAARDLVMQRMPMGSTVKCLATYDRPFWRKNGYSGEAVLEGDPVSVVFDATTFDNERGALLGFVVGQAARTWSARPEAERREAVLGVFSRLFGREAAQPRVYIEKDWTDDPWARGCPVGIVGTGGMEIIAEALRQPVGRIHWAGTETAERWCGYMEGALESGERAAREVDSRLGNYSREDKAP